MFLIEKKLKALANKNRLRIIKMLEKEDLCVCEITAVLGIKQPSVTGHLLKLKEAGIIGERQKGLFTEFFLLREETLIELQREILKIINNVPQVKRDSLKIKTIDRYKLVKK
ncbi:metalloregulator ArsR/SmtB family transcription factor [bacterium]|nr:metalloregulator ArsR/SmtB family transcription factor [bacterium]